MSKKSLQDLFPGITVYESGDTVTNPFSGAECELTGEELSVYDLSRGSEMFGDYKTMRKCLDWFRRNNPKAYMILLD